jgi:hypothetical protein
MKLSGLPNKSEPCSHKQAQKRTSLITMYWSAIPSGGIEQELPDENIFLLGDRRNRDPRLLNYFNLGVSVS